MRQIRKVFHPREIAIVVVIALSMLITGMFLDFNLTSKVYDPVNTSAFGIIFAGIAELPVIACLVFCGVGFITCRIKKPVVWQVLMIIVGALCFIGAAYFTWDTACDWYSFKNTEQYKVLLQVAAVVFTLVVVGTAIPLTFLFTKKVNKETYLKLSITILSGVLIALVVSNATKYMWGRGRPRYIFALDNQSASEAFDPVWSLHPFRSLIYKFKKLTDSSNNFKSFPSGHTLYATMGIFFLPMTTLLSEKQRHNRPLQVGLFYAGLTWALISAISRVYAGAHFLSDTAGGMIATVFSFFLAILIFSLIFKEKNIRKEND